MVEVMRRERVRVTDTSDREEPSLTCGLLTRQKIQDPLADQR
jgi:hypothetical protein